MLKPDKKVSWKDNILINILFPKLLSISPVTAVLNGVLEPEKTQLPSAGMAASPGVEATQRVCGHDPGPTAGSRGLDRAH